MTRLKKRTPLVLAGSSGDLWRLCSSLALRGDPPPWEGGPAVDLEALKGIYARSRRRLLVACEHGDDRCAAMVAVFEEDDRLRDQARQAVDRRRAYWRRRMSDVPAVDPALVR